MTPDENGPGVSADPEQIENEPSSAESVFADHLDQAREYARWLAEDAVVRGLIGPREKPRLWSRHILNSGVVAPLLDADCTVIDIGSGAGLPGIPLAIARPDCKIILVEPLERRTTFLNEVVSALGLTNCTVVRGRAEQVIEKCGGADIVTSRAVAPLATLGTWSAPLLRDGGKMLALKGSSAQDEIDRDRLALSKSGLKQIEIIAAGEGMVDSLTVIVSAVRILTDNERKLAQKNRARVARKMQRAERASSKTVRRG